MSTIWNRNNGGTLSGTERFASDKANTGNPDDSVHYTAEQLAIFSLTSAVPANLSGSAVVGTATRAARADHVHARPTLTELGAEVVGGVTATHTAATLTLDSTYHNKHTPLDTSSNSIAIEIPDTLDASFSWTGRKISASNSVTFNTGAGLITPSFRGQNTCTADDTDITVFAESSSVALVYIVEGL